MSIDDREILDARILIVDDQEPNVSLLTQLLTEAGYTHASFAEPASASHFSIATL